MFCAIVLCYGFVREPILLFDVCPLLKIEKSEEKEKLTHNEN